MTSATFAGRSLTVAIGAIVAIAAPLAGQNEPAVCVARVASLTTGTPQGPRAREVIRCPVSGPSALAWYWSRGDRFDEIEPWIVGASATIRDQRLFRAVSAVALSSRPRADRIDALMVLARYYDDRYRPSEAFLEGDEPGTSLPRRVGIREPVVGLDPLPADSRAQIGRIVFQLAMSDPDSGIRSAAHRLRQALAIDDLANNPLAEGAINSGPVAVAGDHRALDRGHRRDLRPRRRRGEVSSARHGPRRLGEQAGGTEGCRSQWNSGRPKRRP